MVNKILFFIPEQEPIINLLRYGHLASYASSIRSVNDVPELEGVLDKAPANREQLVFVGTKRRTGMEPADLARLIKLHNPKALVVLASVSEQDWSAPLDGSVVLSSGQAVRALVDISMSRA